MEWILIGYQCLLRRSTLFSMGLQSRQLVFKTRDEFGEILVKDHHLLRTLYFGNNKKQSSILLPNLSVLVLFYAQAMMSALLFCPRPKRVLLVGLGGGSIVHFLRRYYPKLAIDVVELRQSVIDVARNYFGLPPEQQVFLVDAREFVRQQVNEGTNYDIVFVDAFDQWGPAEIMTNDEFLMNCRQLAGENGICSFNLWNRREDAYGKTLRQFQQMFDDKLLELSLGQVNSNVILLGFGAPINKAELAGVKGRAMAMKQECGIDFVRFHKLMCKQNLSLFRRFAKHLSLS